MEKLVDLPNIGEILAEKLIGIDIYTFEELVEIGSIEAVLKIGETDSHTCYSMLYALEGAIQNMRWHAIPKEERKILKEEFDLLRTTN
ncbi:MAG: TfoX/Sxy family protein [Chloroflexi bacterium]|nr:TfoX/Sxy family protein [Chloroflexota bacterium]MBT4003948.1 TfoX/Sxy family protein [Chloroflexota bacterium]MBT4305746.1 TfoX/Sxy family protein [Chloroflexota bacterium]MBT4533570.1 TfoX/Sxy family protein [Chloroflexota bacterium]MBT4681787.1 TfoX/Sxy family protein [Chloroflexota bacterium]